MTIDDYEAVYDLWIKCGNGLNNKDDSREGIEKYLNRNPNTSYVAVLDEKVVGVILCGHDKCYNKNTKVLPIDGCP